MWDGLKPSNVRSWSSINLIIYQYYYLLSHIEKAWWSNMYTVLYKYPVNTVINYNLCTPRNDKLIQSNIYHKTYYKIKGIRQTWSERNMLFATCTMSCADTMSPSWSTLWYSLTRDNTIIACKQQSPLPLYTHLPSIVYFYGSVPHFHITIITKSIISMHFFLAWAGCLGPTYCYYSKKPSYPASK